MQAFIKLKFFKKQVAIIGVLAAVAIPAYQSYQDNAKTNVIKGSLNSIAKSFQACLVNNSATNCKTLADIKVKVPAGAGEQTPTQENDGTTTCFGISLPTVASPTHTGCVLLDANGFPSAINAAKDSGHVCDGGVGNAATCP